MSLARLALRLAAVEALCPSALATSGPWPTLAGANVYDSRIDLIEGDADRLDELEGSPIVIVYTEDDELAPYGEAKYPAQEQIVHLAVQILIAAKGAVEVENASGQTETFGAVVAPVTDRQHEALLDMLESMVRRVLGKRTGEDMPPSARIYDRVAMEVRHIDSVPQRSADRATRYAARTVTFRLKIKAESWPSVDRQPSGIDLLPEPLRGVAKALDPASTGYALCQSLIALAPSPPTRTPMATIRAFLGMGRTPTQESGVDSDIEAQVPFPRYTYFLLGF